MAKNQNQGGVNLNNVTEPAQSPNPKTLGDASRKAGSILTSEPRSSATPQQVKDDEERQQQRELRNENQRQHMTAHKDREVNPAGQAVEPK